jgi:hypothetical protein
MSLKTAGCGWVKVEDGEPEHKQRIIAFVPARYGSLSGSFDSRYGYKQLKLDEGGDPLVWRMVSHWLAWPAGPEGWRKLVEDARKGRGV